MLCEPEIGVHRYVTPATERALETWRRQIGVIKKALNGIAEEHGCAGRLFKTVSIDRAVEMPPPESGLFYVVWTEQVWTEQVWTDADRTS